MSAHAEFLELVSASIDFDLTEDEGGALNLHLSTCPACRQVGANIRSQASAMAALPEPRLSPTQAEQILAAALRRPAGRPRLGLLAVAALLVTLGGALAVGSASLVDEPTSSVAPSVPPIAQGSASPSFSASVEPTTAPSGVSARTQPPASAAPSTPTPPSASRGLTFPIPYSPEHTGPVRVTPTTGDRLWVSFSVQRATVLALLDEDGLPSKGWPLQIDFADDCLPLASADGGLRLLCYYSEELGECVDVCYEERIYAWDRDGRPLSGWPVTFPVGMQSGINRDGVRMVGDELVVTVFDGGDDTSEGSEYLGTTTLSRVARDGTLHEGTPVPTTTMCCRIGPDGTAFGRSVNYADDGTVTTELYAFDASGPVPGWPVAMPGEASYPGFGPEGRLYVTSWRREGGSLLSILGPNGALVGAGSEPLSKSVVWEPDGDGPMAPLVDATGRAFVVVSEDGVAAGMLAFDANGEPLAGWPYKPATSFGEEGGDCGPGDTGCQSWTRLPELDPSGVAYVFETSDGSKGGRLTAVDVDGAVGPDWPLILQRPGAEFGSVAIADSGTVFAVAYEPEPGAKTSVTILAIAPDKKVRWGTTVIDP